MQAAILVFLVTGWTAFGLVPHGSFQNRRQLSTSNCRTDDSIARTSVMRAESDDRRSGSGVGFSTSIDQKRVEEAVVNIGDSQEYGESKEVSLEETEERNEDSGDVEASELQEADATSSEDEEDEEKSELQIFDETNMQLAIEMAQSA